MHIRYDMKNISDFSNIRKQTSFFLKKENCIFSFYLNEMAVNFSISVKENNKFFIEFNFSELYCSNENNSYNKIIPQNDYRLKNLSFIQELFLDDNSGVGSTQKDDVNQAVDFMIYTIKFINKIKDLSLIA